MKWFYLSGIILLYFILVNGEYQQECHTDRTHTFEAKPNAIFSFNAEIKKRDGLAIDILYEDRKKNDRIEISPNKIGTYKHNGEKYINTNINSFINEGWHDIHVSFGVSTLVVNVTSSKMAPISFSPQSRIKAIKISSVVLKICEESCSIEKKIERKINYGDEYEITAFTNHKHPIIVKMSNSLEDGAIGHFEMKPNDCIFKWKQTNTRIPCGHINPGWDKFKIFVNTTALVINNNIYLPIDVNLKTFSISGSYLVNCTKGNPVWKISKDEITIPISSGQEIVFILKSSVVFSPVFNLNGIELKLIWNDGLKLASSGNPLQPKSYHIIFEATSENLILYNEQKDILFEIKIENPPEYIKVSSIKGEYQFALSVEDPLMQPKEPAPIIGPSIVTETTQKTNDPDSPVNPIAITCGVLIPVAIVGMLILIWKKYKKYNTIKKKEKENRMNTNENNENQELIEDTIVDIQSYNIYNDDLKNTMRSDPHYQKKLVNVTLNNNQQDQKISQLTEPVKPDKFSMETDDKKEIVFIQSDAVLYRVKEQADDGSLKIHSILKMMSGIPDSLLPKGNTLSNDGASTKTIKLSIPGSILPFSSSKESFNLNEYVYFANVPEDIQEISFETGKYIGKMHLDPKNADINLYLNVFRQWNQIAMQMHNKKEIIPPEIVPFIERLFKTAMDEINNKTTTSIRSRLDSKALKGYEITFQTLLNTFKNILANKHFSNEMKLSETILSTNVTSNKYTEKVLQMKGHTGEEYDKDIEEFRSVIRREESNLMKIEVTTEDCCSVYFTSTISDLKDENLNKLFELNKYDFLKTFTISGIPIFSPLKDSKMINPWTYSIGRILKSPYKILSQVVLEEMSTANPNSFDEKNKGVKLQEHDEETCFNAIIPVFPPNVAPQMKKIMRTKIYAMCCTFAILKNPHVIDYNIHMAALGTAWVRMLYENPNQPRPEYVEYQIKCIEATAAQYSEKPSFAKYRNLLKEHTYQAMMTESTIEIDGSTLKCESLVKPMFILHMAVLAKQITDNAIIKKIAKTILIEYIGRCISNKLNYEKNTAYSDFFTEGLNCQENEMVNVERYIKETKAKLAENAMNLLEKFYYEDECRKAAEKAAKEVCKQYYYELASTVQIKLNKKQVNELRSVSACGDVSWTSLKVFAKEVGLSESDVEDLFSEENIFLYVAHGFKYTNSRERLETPFLDYNKCVVEITNKVKEESSKLGSKCLIEKLVEEMLNSWLTAYTEAHTHVVESMTKSQIIQEARMKEIEVNEETFDEVYKRYRHGEGLMGNACQSRSCPWFLKPMKTYNEHRATEKRHVDFPHSLHDVRSISNKIAVGE